jgi:hypothetical protein
MIQQLRITRRWAPLALPLFIIGLAITARAQENPFGADPFGTFGSETEAEPAPSAGEAPVVEEETEQDPAVLAIRESNPSTPLEFTRAARQLSMLGRPEMAQGYLQQVLDSNPNAATLERLHVEFGSTMFLQMLTRENLQPAGRQLGDAVLEAAHAAVRDPARLSALISELDDPALAVRRAAIADLKRADDTAVAALINALADRSRADRQASIKHALVAFGDRTVDPLVAALSAEELAVRGACMEVLGRVRSERTIPFLLAPALHEDAAPALREPARAALVTLLRTMPTRPEAERFLARRTRIALDRDTSIDRDPDETEVIWKWDESSQKPVVAVVSPAVADLHRATLLAQQLYRLSPENSDFRRLYFATLLETEQQRLGLSATLPTGAGTPTAEVAAEGVATIEDLLVYAFEKDLRGAALAALQLLGKLGDDRLLKSSDGQPRVTARAIKHPDRRVRFAAVRTIDQLDPRTPYPGSSFFAENLGYFIHTVGLRRALVAHPRTTQAQTLVGMLAELGIEADSAQAGTGAYLLARQNPDYEFALISDLLDQPPVGETLQQIRRDPRTGALPVGLLAREERFDELERLTEEDPLSQTFPRPHSLSGLNLAVRRLLTRGAADRVLHEERLAQGIEALEILDRLAEHSERYPFYDLLRQQSAVTESLDHHLTSTVAARILGNFSTPSAQQALVNIASQNTRPIALRREAAAAFDAAVRRRGLLLTKSEVLQQYNRYNRSRFLDRATQQVLGALLDSIEASMRGAVNRQDASTAVES